MTSALARGDLVIAAARNLAKLDDELGGRVPEDQQDNIRALQLDITAGEEVLKAKANEAAAMWGRIDVLVNNAGQRARSVR